MSQYELTPKDSKHHVIIGWDPPLNSLFLHVTDTTKDEDDPDRDVVWIPKPGQFAHDLDDIVQISQKYAMLGPEIYNSLIKDMD